MKIQEGTFECTYQSNQLSDPNAGKGKLFDVISGQIYFLLERESDMTLNFYHASPGTGTRVASIDLNKIGRPSKIMIVFRWSPLETSLSVGNLENGSGLLTEKGIVSKKQFRVDPSGGVIQIGDTNVDVMGFTVFQNGKPLLRPVAIDIWKETKVAIDVVQSQMILRDFLDSVVLFNTITVMLVTGFESYMKRRFLEIEDEGLTPNFNNLVKKFLSTEELNLGISNAILEKASKNNISPTAELVRQNRINFQNFSNTKTAFNKGYDIKFGEIIPDSSNLTNVIRATINYRHQIIHVSPLAATIGDEFSPPLPQVPKKDFIPQLIDAFDCFIKKLHEHTITKPR